MAAAMRLAFVLLWNLIAALVWPLRALLRAAFGHRAPEWVEVRLQHPLTDFVRTGGWLRRRLRPSRARSLQSLRGLFEEAHRSPTCKGLVLRVETLEGSGAQLTELAGLIEAFRKPLGNATGNAGKEVIVWAESLSGRAYAALCGATRIHLPPGGGLDLTGVAVELTSAGAALSMIGIRPEFFRREEHKTAPEMFTRSEPSAVQREVANGLLDEAFEALLAGVARRGIDRARAQELVNHGPYFGRTAFEAGLLDRPLFWDEVVEGLQPTPAGAKPDPDLGTERGLKTSGRLASSGFRRLRVPGAVGIIPLRGIIRSGKSGAFPGAGRFCGSDSLAAALERGRRDPKLKSLLLYIDSRGGSAPASELMWREICRAAKEKPVIAYVDSVAASGGYYAACGAGRILVAPLSIVGSIGVFFGRFDVSEALGRIGLHRELLVRGDNAGLVWPTRPLVASERAAAEAMVEGIYKDFVGVVAQGRKRTPAEILPLAGGRIYTGKAAQAVGLVDGVSTFVQALAEAAKQGGLSDARRIQILEDSPSGPAALAGLGGSIQSLLKPQALAYHLGTQWAEEPTG
jgi:protease IV